MHQDATDPKEQATLSLRGATFLGVGSMVGAGIFALLGEAGAVAGAATWLSFLLAGLLTLLLGYTVARLGARYPSSGGVVAYLREAFGNGHVVGVAAWLAYFTFVILAAMVAVSFGDYASALIFDSPDASRILAVVLIVAMASLNVRGASTVDKVQTVIVLAVIASFTVFVVASVPVIETSNLDPATYPGWGAVVSSIALTFFAYLGFAVITFSAGDLKDPKRELPRATYTAIAIATTIYVLVSLAVFGSLTVAQVIESGSTAIAEAARPSLGQFGYTLISLTAMLATASSTNATLYGTNQLTRMLGTTGQFPPVFARTSHGRPVGLVVTAAAALVLAVAVDLTAIASLGTAIALALFLLVAVAGLQLREHTGAHASVMVAAIVGVLVILVFFAVDTYRNAPATFVAIVVLLVAAVAIDYGWKWSAQRAASRTPERS